MPLTPKEIAEFLDRLDNDDDFRDRLKNDSASVLDEYGISYDPDKLPCPADITLPEKGEVAAHYDTYKDTLFPNDDFALRLEHRLDLGEL